MKKLQLLRICFWTMVLIFGMVGVARADYILNSVTVNGNNYTMGAQPLAISINSLNNPLINFCFNLGNTADNGYTYAISLSIPGIVNTTVPVVSSSTPLSIPLSAGTYNGTISLIKTPTAGGTSTQSDWSFNLVVPALDTTSPTVTTTPSAFGNLAISSNIVVTFSEDIKLPSDPSMAVILRNGSTIIPISITAQNNAITIDPTSNLAYNTSYTLSLGAGITDLAGNSLVPTSLTVTTAADTAPVITVYPADKTVSVPLSTSITITVNKLLNTSTVTTSNITLTETASQAVVPYSIGVNSYGGTTSVITLTPSSPLLSSTEYTVNLLTNGVRDVNNNYLPAQTWTFTTENLRIYNQYPSPHSDDFPVDNAITFNFNQMVMASSVSNTTVYLQRYDSTSKISAAVTYDNSGYRVTLKPSKPLEYGTRYRVFVTSGIKDLSNKSFADTSWYFTTEERDGSSLVYAKNPSPNQRNVSTDISISFRFSTRMDEDTINEDTVYLRREGSSSDIDATVTYDEDTRTVTLTPEESLLLDTEYTVYVSSRIEDYYGDRINSASWSFTTGSFESSRIESREPYPNERGVPLDTRIRIEFSDRLKSSTVKTSNIYLRKSGSSSNIKCDISYNSSNREVILAPLEELLPNTTYTVFVSNKVEDAAGNKLSASSWSFTTEDRDQKLIYRYPEIGSYQVPIDIQIRAGFSMPLAASTVNISNCQLKRFGYFYGASSTNVPVKVSYDATNRQIIIKPTAKLAYDTEYSVTISNRVKDYTGNFINEITWSFTTMPDPTPRGTLENPLIKLGNNYLTFSGTARPYIKSGRTMVPFRTILEALGAEVQWNSSQQKITTTLKNNHIELYIGKRTAYQNGRSINLEVAPEIRYKQTMIPLRFVSEALGKKVTWDKNTCTVIIQ